MIIAWAWPMCCCTPTFMSSVDKELLEAATFSLQAQERFAALLKRKLKDNEDSSAKEGE